MELELFRKIFEKIFKISNSMKIHLVTAGRTDWHDGDNSRFSQFHECA